MTAVKMADWDKFSDGLRALSDAIGEDYFDRPNLMNQQLFRELLEPVEELYNEIIAPRLSNNLRGAVNGDLFTIKNNAANNEFHSAISRIENIFKTLPELSGRFERYEDATMRRKETYYLLQGNKSLAEIFDLHAQGKAAFFFDLDGTLVDAEPGRNAGYQADERLQFVLNRLNVQSESAMSVITGRPEMFMQQVFPNGSFFSATEHGVFVRNKVGGDLRRSYQGSQDVNALQEYIAKEMIARGLDANECFVEMEKSGSLTVQFTKASNPQKAALIIGELLQQVMFSPRNGTSSDPLVIVDGNVEGNRVIDLVPQTADKGKTLQWFYETYPHIFAGKKPVMFGDSGGDETAMQWAKDNGGFAIGVGKESPVLADARLSGINTTRNIITSLAEHAENTRFKRTRAPFFKRV
jgi:HAD superfamily hydrolase (TIGR01484 family)